MSGEDILSVLFLALICIVVAGLVMNLSPKELIIPTFAFIAIGTWVAYDYILLNRYKAKEKCLVKKQGSDDLKQAIDEINNDAQYGGEIGEDEMLTDSIADPVSEGFSMSKLDEREFEIDLYNQNVSIQDLHKHMGCSGDNMIANRMKYMSLQSQVAQDARARMNARTLQPYLEEELDEASKRDWWENNALNAVF